MGQSNQSRGAQTGLILDTNSVPPVQTPCLARAQFHRRSRKADRRGSTRGCLPQLTGAVLCIRRSASSLVRTGTNIQMMHDQQPRSTSTFDYVVVGTGAAGAIVSARLSEDPGISVCALASGLIGMVQLVRSHLVEAFEHGFAPVVSIARQTSGAKFTPRTISTSLRA